MLTRISYLVLPGFYPQLLGNTTLLIINLGFTSRDQLLYIILTTAAGLVATLNFDCPG